MRHRRAVKRLSRTTSERKALLRSIIRALFISERISTTYPRAKEASILADRLITLGKRNTMTSKKTAISILGSKELINRLFNDIAPRFINYKGGYTRTLQLSRPRKGDAARMAILELTERRIAEKAPVKKAEKAEKVKKAPPKEEVKELKKVEKPAEKEEKQPAVPPKPVTTIQKEKLEEEKARERAKSEQDKLQKGFFKGLRRYFRRKSM